MSALAAGPRVDQVLRDAPLGIRLLDPLDGRPVADGLEVIAYRVAPGSPPVRPTARDPLGGERVHRLAATANSAMVWVFPEPLGARAAAWHVEVRDPDRRFLPVRFTAQIGPGGLLALAPGAASLATPAGTPLFSAPGRPPAASAAVLRAALWDPVGARPAAWALLEASVGSGPVTWGLADDQGQVAVFLRHPDLRSAVCSGSGSDFGAGRLAEVCWDVRLRAFYRPGGATGPLPDLAAVVAQPAAMLWSRLADRTPLEPQTLKYGAELVVRSFEAEVPSRAVRVTTA
jgi:hypothetical protein